MAFLSAVAAELLLGSVGERNLHVRNKSFTQMESADSAIVVAAAFLIVTVLASPCCHIVILTLLAVESGLSKRHTRPVPVLWQEHRTGGL